MWRLHQGHLGVLEITDHRVQGVGQRYVVGVEHEHQLALGQWQRMVDVACLRMAFVGTRHVAHTPLVGKLCDLRAGAVVQEPRRVWVAHERTAGERRLEHAWRLVVGADVHVDASSRRCGGSLAWRHVPCQPCQRREIPQAVALGQQQARPKDGVGAMPAPTDTPSEVRRRPAQCDGHQQAQQARMTCPPGSPAFRDHSVLADTLGRLYRSRQSAQRPAEQAKCHTWSLQRAS